MDDPYMEADQAGSGIFETVDEQHYGCQMSTTDVVATNVQKCNKCLVIQAD